jgi:hypothetical protein
MAYRLWAGCHSSWHQDNRACGLGGYESWAEHNSLETSTALFFQAPPTVVFVPSTLPEQFVFNKEKHYSAWEQTEIQNFQKDGFQYVGGRSLLVAGKEGYCLEGVDPERKTQMNIRCILPGSRIYVNFSGEKRYVDAFYSIVESLSSIKPPSGNGDTGEP